MTIGERYLELVLRYARVAPEGEVDSYTGPPELRQRVESEDPPTPAELADEARSLAGAVAAAPDATRVWWLAAQLPGIEAACRELAGERIPFVELVERCYGVAPRPVPDDALAEAHAKLDRVLEGRGDVRPRAERWLETQVVPPDRLAPWWPG
jgi:hypothetical protein